MTHQQELLHNYQACEPTEIILGDDSVIKTEGVGELIIDQIIDGKPARIRITDVLYVPSLRKNLLSPTRFLHTGHTTKIHSNGADVIKDSTGQVMLHAAHCGNMLKLLIRPLPVSAQEYATSAKESININLLHQ